MLFAFVHADFSLPGSYKLTCVLCDWSSLHKFVCARCADGKGGGKFTSIVLKPPCSSNRPQACPKVNNCGGTLKVKC
jgi:hypothetical protein